MTPSGMGRAPTRSMQATGCLTQNGKKKHANSLRRTCSLGLQRPLGNSSKSWPVCDLLEYDYRLEMESYRAMHSSFGSLWLLGLSSHGPSAVYRMMRGRDGKGSKFPVLARSYSEPTRCCESLLTFWNDLVARSPQDWVLGDARLLSLLCVFVWDRLPCFPPIFSWPAGWSRGGVVLRGSSEFQAAWQRLVCVSWFCIAGLYFIQAPCSHSNLKLIPVGPLDYIFGRYVDQLIIMGSVFCR